MGGGTVSSKRVQRKCCGNVMPPVQYRTAPSYHSFLCQFNHTYVRFTASGDLTETDREKRENLEGPYCKCGVAPETHIGGMRLCLSIVNEKQNWLSSIVQTAPSSSLYVDCVAQQEGNVVPNVSRGRGRFPEAFFNYRALNVFDVHETAEPPGGWPEDINFRRQP